MAVRITFIDRNHWRRDTRAAAKVAEAEFEIADVAMARVCYDGLWTWNNGEITLRARYNDGPEDDGRLDGWSIIGHDGQLYSDVEIAAI